MKEIITIPDSKKKMVIDSTSGLYEIWILDENGAMIDFGGEYFTLAEALLRCSVILEKRTYE